MYRLLRRQSVRRISFETILAPPTNTHQLSRQPDRSYLTSVTVLKSTVFPENTQ